MSEPTDREELIRLTTVVDALVGEVRAVGTKVDSLRDEHIYQLEHKMVVLEHQNKTQADKINKIEEQFTWATRAIIGEGLALIAGIVMWTIQNFR